MLAENTENTLTPKQVKYAETIHSSGTDLLTLINDILDLSKIESGKMDIEIGSVRFIELRDFCSRTFRHVADGKGLDYSVEVAENLTSENIITDAKRVQQVLKNLLSNALKFTEHGTVKLRIERVTSGWTPNHTVLHRMKSAIAFSVTDTGIGIPLEKQRIIFEAFQQADGTTSRKYGGTGLGLSISRELTRLLGGEIRLKSSPEAGSTFTLYLPQTYVAPVPAPKAEIRGSMDGAETLPALMVPEPAGATNGNSVEIVLAAGPASPIAVVHDIEIDDDRHVIQPSDAVLLIVEDDVTFARILLDMAHERGLRALVALRGHTALTLAREFKPGAITLDITLPDMAGWTILDRLKHDPATRHVPVHIITGDENRRRGLALGAMTYLEKTVTKDNLSEAFENIHYSLARRSRKLLVVTADGTQPDDWNQSIGGKGVEIIQVGSGGEALGVVRHQYLDGIALDYRLSDIPPAQLAEEIQREIVPLPPIVIFGPPSPGGEIEAEVRRLARHMVIRYAGSPERLLEETVLLLHRAETDLTDRQREIISTLRRAENALAGKKVLVVDDDVRNIFALSTLLEQHGLQVVHAENGRAGIELLLKTPGIDGVLMDIMMPEMDGYETTRAIRQIPEFGQLPIIAVTAKAMKGDRAKCIEAGASDYITKPVDLDQLFSALRVWMAPTYDSGAGVSTAAETGVVN